jgi:hypothetical protein
MIERLACSPRRASHQKTKKAPLDERRQLQPKEEGSSGKQAVANRFPGAVFGSLGQSAEKGGGAWTWACQAPVGLLTVLLAAAEAAV